MAEVLQEAGADASYIEGPRSIEELKIIAERSKVLIPNFILHFLPALHQCKVALWLVSRPALHFLACCAA